MFGQPSAGRNQPVKEPASLADVAVARLQREAGDTGEVDHAVLGANARRILRLAAFGMTAREAAQGLAVGPDSALDLPSTAQRPR